MSTKWMFGALVVLGCLARVELAHAGCPSTCQGSLGGVTTEPALGCVSIEASIGTCACAVEVKVRNSCAGTLEVRSDDVRCGDLEDCFTLPPGESGIFDVPIRSTGSKQWSLPLQESASGAHTLNISASVTEYDPQPGCSVAGAGRHCAVESSWVGLLLGCCALARRWASFRQKRCPLKSP